MRVLFVCLGNICRSPAAEAVFRAKVEAAGLADRIASDSAGTDAYHVGERADQRMRQHGKDRGYELTSIARKLIPADFASFDLIVTMDESNFANAEAVQSRCSRPQARLERMTDYCHNHQVAEVPDPYYGGAAGFELVFDILDDACEHLLASLDPG